MARPRDTRIDERVLDATRAVIEARGVGAVTVAEVARLARVSRPSVYRRWPSTTALVFAAQSNASVAVDFPDHGSLRADLVAAVAHLTSTIETADRAVTAEQIGLMIADHDFAETVWRTRWALDAERVYAVWQRALARGDVDPAVDGRAVISDIVAIVLFRVAIGHGLTASDGVEGLVDRIVDGVAR